MKLKDSLFILVCITIASHHSASANDDDPFASSIESKNVDSYPVLEKSANDVTRNFSKLVRIGEILDLFSINRIGALWTVIEPQLSATCSNDMMVYFRGLENEKLWALKMDDASGHYTNGYFFGNTYWTGSMKLCENIHSGMPTFVVPKNTSRNMGPSSNLQAQYSQSVQEDPPFRPGFFGLKVLINETRVTKSSRTIFIGQCLPLTCSIDDIEKMAELSTTNTDERYVGVLAIRAPTQREFNLWHDLTFQILAFVTILVVILLGAGTSYDLVLMRRAKRRLATKKYSKEVNSESSSNIGCTTYDLTAALPDNKKLNCVGIGIGLPDSNVNNNNSDENLAMDATQSDEEEKLSIYSELLLSFSLITNFNAICDRSVGSDTISSIHGLRTLSMVWVILGHTCIVGFKYSDNMEFRKLVEKQFMFQTISNAAYSVDTFFFISGFLVSYIYFRTNAKGKLEKLTKGANEFTAGTLHFLGLIGYRFMRLTTPYLYVLGVVEVTMKYFEYKSIFEPPTLDHINCHQFWWRNILYINTFFPFEEMCMLWSWYLADDTQFYILGAIILIIAVRHFKIAASTVILFILSSWITTAAIAFSHNHQPTTDDPLALFDKIYDKPWTRLGPYMIGMTVGWILFKTNCKVKMSKLAVVAGWMMSATILLSLIYGLYNTQLSPWAAAAFSSLSHSAWAASLAWIIIACSTGYGGWINNLLSTSVLYPFSRVTYCAYLIHPIVIRFYALNSDAPMHLGVDSMITNFFGQVVSSFLLAFAISLAFEAPVVTMLKIIAPNRKKRI